MGDLADLMADAQALESVVLRGTFPDGSTVDIACIPIGHENPTSQWIEFHEGDRDAEPVPRDGAQDQLRRCMPDVRLIHYEKSRYGDRTEA